MFYDMFLDEIFYLGGEEIFNKNYNPDVLEGLDQYKKYEIKNFGNGKVTILKKNSDIEKFIKISRNVLSNNEKLYYGKINEENARNILKYFPCDLKGFNLSLSTNAIKHIFKQHGNPIKEKMRGQIAITDYDYSLIPFIIKNFDKLKIANSKCNNKSLEFIKMYENVTYHLVMYVSFRSHNLEVKTFFKK